MSGRSSEPRCCTLLSNSTLALLQQQVFVLVFDWFCTLTVDITHIPFVSVCWYWLTSKVALSTSRAGCLWFMQPNNDCTASAALSLAGNVGHLYIWPHKRTATKVFHNILRYLRFLMCMMLEQRQLKACQIIRTSAVMMVFAQMQGMISFMLCQTRSFVT